MVSLVDEPTTHCSHCGIALGENAYAAAGFPYVCCSSACLDAAIGLHRHDEDGN